MKKKDIGTKNHSTICSNWATLHKEAQSYREVQVFTGYKLKNVVNSWFKNIILPVQWADYAIHCCFRALWPHTMAFNIRIHHIFGVPPECNPVLNSFVTLAYGT